MKTMSETNAPDVPRAPEDWWRAFFEEDFGELQLAGAFDARTVEDVDLITRWLGLEDRRTILDAPCGTGRIGLELARRGHDVVGIDFNPNVIERATERAASENLSAQFRIQDLRVLDELSCYDAALCWWGSYGYFNDDDNLEYLQRVSRALKPGGQFVIDTHIAETLYPRLVERSWSQLPGAESTKVLEHRRIDHETGRVECTWTFIRDGKESSYETSIRIPTYRELCQTLRSVGFTAFAAYQRPDGGPFRFGAPRLSLVARK